MYCQVCGTQLPSETRACPKCGTVVPASSPNAPASAYDPTVAASSGSSTYDPTVPATPGSSPAVRNPSPLPPTQYGPNPYESPYAAHPYNAPPPPRPRRAGNRTAIIVGVIVLVLLLIGGGVFLWLRLATAATFTANGAFTILDSHATNVTQSGQDTITSYIEHGVYSGDVTGTYTLTGATTTHTDNTGTGSGIITCTCTVSGKSGTLQESISYTVAADGSFQGQLFALLMVRSPVRAVEVAQGGQYPGERATASRCRGAGPAGGARCRWWQADCPGQRRRREYYGAAPAVRPEKSS
jgi:hypothetical protein